MLDLTPEEARRLRQLADDIVAHTQDRAYWLTGVRHTCLTLLQQVTQWLGDPCVSRDPATAWACVRPTGHTGHHLTVLGHTWEHHQEATSP